MKSHSENKLAKLRLRLIQLPLGVLSLLAILYAPIALLWHVPLASIIFVLLAVLLNPFNINRRFSWVIRSTALTITIVLLLLFPYQVLESTENRMKFLSKKLVSEGIDGFGLGDKIGIYGAHAFMGLGGLIFGYPEVAVETLSMVIPGGRARSWSSDFAMESPRIRRPLKRMIVQLEQLSLQINEHTLKTKRIAWAQYGSDTRVGFALNPFHLKAIAKRIEDRWQIKCTATVDMRYPPRTWLLLFSYAGRDIHFEEGLLWVLQESGWIFPYQGSWEWTIYSDDYRLK
jgi:hypothetical protein